MPFFSALSTVSETAAALDAVCSEALAAVAKPELALLFFSPHHAGTLSDLAPALPERLGAKAIIGCMGETIVGGEREIEQEPALSLWLADWNRRVEIEPFHLTARRTPDGLSLLGWPDALLEGDPARSAMLLLGDPHTFPVSELFLPQVNDNHRGLRVVGGMASGSSRRGQTAIMFRDRLATQGAVGVLLRGDVKMHSVVSQGCRPIGRPFVITKAEENIVQELGGKSPLEQLRELWPELSPRDRELFQRGSHLGLVINEYKDKFERGDFLVRNLAGIDANTGVLAVMDYVRVGQTVQFHVRDAETADEDLREMLQTQRKTVEKTGGALLFSCNGRGTRLFPDPNHDAGAIQSELGKLPLAGFFAAGELGPVGGKNFIHGFTACVAVFEG